MLRAALAICATTLLQFASSVSLKAWDPTNQTIFNNETVRNYTIKMAAANASKAFLKAKHAAEAANKAARTSIHITENTQDALDRARHEVRDARSHTSGLSDEQKKLLKKAEQRLRDATHQAEYGRLRQAHYLKAKGDIRHSVTKIRKLEQAINTTSNTSELDALEGDLASLRRKMHKMAEDAMEQDSRYVDDAGTKDKSDDKVLQELDAEAEQLAERIKVAKENPDSASLDELKAELEELREAVERLKLESRKKEAKEDPTIIKEFGELVVAIPDSQPKNATPKVAQFKYEIPKKRRLLPLPIRELSKTKPGTVVVPKK
jgi:DNA repair exonuclease SbcCD ATPase subunit